VRWTLLNVGFGFLCSIVGLPWSHHTQSLANVTMATKATIVPMETKLFTAGKNDLRSLLASGIKHLRIYFEPLDRFA
jgi:hypothetical protein